MEKIKYFTSVIVVLILISGFAGCAQKSHPEVEMEVSSLKDTLANRLSEDGNMRCIKMDITDIRFDKIKNAQGEKVYAVVISNRLVDEEYLQMCKESKARHFYDMYVSITYEDIFKPLVKKCIDEEVDFQVVSYAEGSDLEPIITDISHKSLKDIKKESFKYALDVIQEKFEGADWLKLDYDGKNLIISYQQEEDSTEDLTQSSEEELKKFATEMLFYFDEQMDNDNFIECFFETSKNVVFILKNKSGGEEKRIFLNTEETCLRALKAIEGMYQNVDKLSAQGLSDEASEFKIKGVYYHYVIAKSIERDTIKVNNFTDNQKKELSEIYHRLEKWFN